MFIQPVLLLVFVVVLMVLFLCKRNVGDWVMVCIWMRILDFKSAKKSHLGYISFASSSAYMFDKMHHC